MGRGGYQKPSGPRPPGGPGKISQRTDGNVQPIRTPPITSSPDLQVGQGQALTDAQRIARLGTGGGASPPPRPAGAPLAPGPLPAHLIGPSNRPGEPVTTGMDMGPGAGSEALNAQPNTPDQREQVLMYLMQNFGNDSAARMLASMRAERQTPPAPSMGPAGVPAAPTAPPAPPEPSTPTAVPGPPSASQGPPSG